MTDPEQPSEDSSSAETTDLAAASRWGRLRADFAKQGGVVKIFISVSSAVAAAAALAVFGALLGVFDGDLPESVVEPVSTGSNTSPIATATSVPPTTTSTPVEEEPFTVFSTKQFGSFYEVWLDKDMPGFESWPAYATLNEYQPAFLEPLGVAQDPSWVQLTIEGTASRPATINGARAAVESCSEPAHAAHYVDPAEGVNESIGWYFEVDGSDTQAYEMVGESTKGPPYFRDKTITIAPGELVTINAKGFTESSDCRWVLELDVVFQGERSTITVDDDGEPFRVSSGDPDATTYFRAYWDQTLEVRQGESGTGPVEVYLWTGDAYEPVP